MSNDPGGSAARKRMFRVQWRGNNWRHRHSSSNPALTDRIVIQRSLVIDLPWWAHRLLQRIKP